MALPGGTDYVRRDGETAEARRIRELREMALSAKQAGESWGRRWYFSLAIGNAAALAAVASATLTFTANQPPNANIILRWCMIPAAWSFAFGLVSGAVLPYCWQRKVETIGDWVGVTIDEIDQNGPVMYPGEDEEQYSDELLKKFEQHQDRWAGYLDRCEIAAVSGFLLGLMWMLLCFSKWAIG
jgi:hypothetical protein